MLLEETASAGKSVIVQAGRRLDAAGAEPARFPSANVSSVRARIKASFIDIGPLALVTSAACGADLIALDIAAEMDVECFIVLPTALEVFRESSVTDRPGDWGSRFDRAIEKAHVEVLTLPDGQDGYFKTNLRLLDRGEAIANRYGVEARVMVVWDQKSRGSDDVTGHFLAQARLRHLPVMEISTL